MKKQFSITAIRKHLFYVMLVVVFLAGCIDKASDQIKEVKKPAVVFSKNVATEWFQDDQLTLKDAEGNLIEIDGVHVKQFCNKYNVGDTIK